MGAGVHSAARKRALPSGASPARMVWRLPDWLRPYDADVSGERARRTKVGGIAELGDETGRGLGASAVDGGQQAADLMLTQFAVDIAVRSRSRRRSTSRSWQA